jgi:hypothetical protein
MRRRTMKLTCFVAVLLGSAVLVSAFPEPQIVPSAWQFDLTLDKPRPVSIRDLNGQTQWFWYLTYQVQNNTGSERLFIPEITIATDEGDIISSGKNVPSAVFDAVKLRQRNALLLGPMQIVGRMLQGPDFAKDGVAIWPAFDHSVNRVDVFVAGLSGETQVVEHPLTKDPVVTRKVLMMSFDTPGSKTHPQEQAVISQGQEWIMR